MPARRAPVRKISRRKKRTNTSRSMVSRATKQYVRRVMPKVEMKETWVHINENQLNTLTQGYLVTFPTIAPGSAIEQRIGQSLIARGFHMKGTLYNNSTQESFVRQVIIGFSPTVDPIANFFRGTATNVSSAVSSINGLDAMYYPINKTELKVYHDKVYRLAGSVSGSAGANTKMFSRFLKLGGKKIMFKGTDAVPDNWTYAVIHIASDANDDTSTGTTVELSSLNRFYYNDS
uniref:Capsid protein n=1 Tax=Emberiza rustica CRESS-DNA-virus sp. TaxID=2815032 RepID=A0A8A4XB68_9VIRU|nr:MAG: capsid protein [Emberiza rustica CRESS-DNA-virus sp.]